VANVMNQSIEIQTKVLETMDFSVGTVDPDTLDDGSSAGQIGAASGGAFTSAGACHPILNALSPSDPTNVLTMGDPGAENSLRTDQTFATHSFWRLSSNSSGGATVYYAGNTLSNTEGDMIAGFGPNKSAPSTGTAQFGLALDNAGTYTATDYETTPGDTGTEYNPHLVDYAMASDSNGASIGGIPLETAADNGAGLSSDFTTYQAAHPAAVHFPQLYPLVPTTNYSSGTGGINGIDSGGITTQFAYDTISQTVPIPIASESTQVVDCVTGKMRYAANIAATTPAGIYTTKINYIAAPQY